MERFHFAFAAEFAERLPHFKSFSVSPCLAKSRKSFEQNVLRGQSLGNLPILLVGASVVTQTSEMLAKSQLGIEEGDVRFMRGHPQFDPVQHSKKERLRKELQLKWFKRAEAGEVANGMVVGEINLASFIAVGGAELKEGINAVLIGMVTGLWTAFEVLVEQIWRAVVLERPKLEVSITNKESKQSGFRSLRKIRLLYQFTFRVNNVGIFQTLNDDRLDALALTRNILIHTDGIIDKTFDDRRAAIPALNCFSSVKLGEKIELTGQIVRELLAPAVELGCDLVRCVDAWLINNP